MDNNLDLDLEFIPRELKLLIDIITLDNDEKVQDAIEESHEGINWNLFVELAFHHRVYPLLSSKLKKIPNKLVPQFVIQTLSQNYKVNTFKMLYLCSEMEFLKKICEESKINILFLKGPVLAQELYGDVSLRTSSDLDVLIPIVELENMENLLIKSGYVKDDYIQTVLSDWKWRHHHLTYIHPEKDIKVEVHWRLNPGPGKEPSFRQLWERKRTSLVISSPIYYLGEEDLFLFLVSHGARHGWSRLRWLIDIHQIVKQNMDWIKLYQLLKNNHYLHIGGQALILTSQILNTEINNGHAKRLIKGNRPRRLAQEAIYYLEKMVNLHTIPLPEDIARYHKHHLFSLMSNQHKFFFIVSLLYPYPSDAEILPLPKNLHFLYFPLRPLLWAWRKTRKQALQ